MISKRLVLLVATVTAALLVAVGAAAAAVEVPRMSTEELKSQLGSADLVVLDVRGSWDWVGAKEKISGAERVEPGAVTQWANHYDQGQTIVLYCS